jgi:toxin HigB-1
LSNTEVSLEKLNFITELIVKPLKFEVNFPRLRGYEDDDRRELNPQYVNKIARMLARLDVATRPEQLDIPGFRLHTLKGELAGYWSITVRANWRIIFRFEEGDATDVDLVDYH